MTMGGAVIGAITRIGALSGYGILCWFRYRATREIGLAQALGATRSDAGAMIEAL